MGYRKDLGKGPPTVVSDHVAALYLAGTPVSKIAEMYCEANSTIRWWAQIGCQHAGIEWEEAKAIYQAKKPSMKNKHVRREELSKVVHASEATGVFGAKEERAFQWMELYLSGYSQGDIASEFELSTSAVSKTLKWWARKQGLNWDEVKATHKYRRQNGFGKTGCAIPNHMV